MQCSQLIHQLHDIGTSVPIAPMGKQDLGEFEAEAFGMGASFDLSEAALWSQGSCSAQTDPGSRTHRGSLSLGKLVPAAFRPRAAVLGSPCSEV